ncbi:hypothetical protein RCL1_000342 [Eukaryota sp. TZLM3-RCL]
MSEHQEQTQKLLSDIRKRKNEEADEVKHEKSQMTEFMIRHDYESLRKAARREMMHSHALDELTRGEKELISLTSLHSAGIDMPIDVKRYESLSKDSVEIGQDLHSSFDDDIDKEVTRHEYDLYTSEME